MRYELADYEWVAIRPMLPNKPRGVPRVDDRRVLNGILWRFRTGSPWAETCHVPAGTSTSKREKWYILFTKVSRTWGGGALRPQG